MSEIEKEDEFRFRDRVAFRVMEHLITRRDGDLTRNSTQEKIDEIAAMAYAVANAMCKRRLVAFT